MSESRRFTLETQVDTTGARAGFNEITQQAGAMANAVRETSQRAQASVSGIGNGASASSEKVEAAQRNLVGSIQRTAAAMQTGSRSSSEYYETLGRQRGIDPAILEPYLAQLREVEAAQKKTKTAVGSATPEMNEFGVSAGQTAAALRQLPAQMSDIVSSLAGGQSPFMVLIQQGGQIKDSFGGVGAAISAIGGEVKSFFVTAEEGAGAVKSVSGALAGLVGQQQEAANGAQDLADGTQQVVEGANGAADSVNSLAEASETAKKAYTGVTAASGPMVLGLGLAVAAVGAVSYAYNKGAKEGGEFARAIILSGNAAGASVQQLNEAARQIGAVSGDRSAAAAALVELTATGQVSIDNMQRFGAVALDVQKVVGRAVADTAKDFADLGESPLATLTKINDKYHFITAATYAQVKALQDQGKASEAASLAQNAYADGIDKQRQKVLDTLSDWERGWLRIKAGASGALDSVVDFAMGRDKTDFEKINGLLKDREGLEENIARAKSRGLTANVAAYQAELDANTRAINAVRTRGDTAKAAAKAESDTAQATQLRNKWLDESDVLLTKQQKLQRDLTAAETEGLANGLSHEEILKRQEVIRRQNYDVVVEGIDRQIAAVQRLAAVEDARSQRRLLGIAAAHAAGDITDDDAARKTAAEDIATIERNIAAKQQELAKVRQRIGSEADQDSIGGEIALLREQRLTRQTQLEIDLGAAQRQRFTDSYALETAGLVSGQNERQGLMESVKAQREYNEEIGLTSSEVLTLKIQREEALATLKDESAAALDAISPGSKLAQTYRDQSAAIRERYMAEREGAARQKDPWMNLSLAVKQYSEDANNAGAHIGDGLTSGLRSAEDAFASFVTTGKLGFSDFATSVIADIARIEARKGLSALLNLGMTALSAYFSTPSASVGDYTFAPTELDTTTPFLDQINVAGKRATGGPVTGGASYLVGERGPEIFTPNSTGSITPNNMVASAMGGSAGGAPQINTTIQISASGTTTNTTGSDASARQLADMVNAQTKDIITRETRQGGVIWKMTQGRG